MPIFNEDPPIAQKGVERQIQIPKSCNMILVDPSFEFRDKPTIKLMGYQFPQDINRTADFKNREKWGISIDEIEEATGLNFFPDFHKLFSNWENKEARKELVHWDYVDEQ